MKVYIAGPDVFRPEALELAETARKTAASLGHEALLPLDNEATTAEEIFRANLELITECDAVVANLDPFRGDEPDSGTCFEVGVAVALGKRVVGYLSDARPLAEKMAERHGKRYSGSGRQVDPDGNAIEDFGLPLNLMLSVPCEIIDGGLGEALAALSATKGMTMPMPSPQERPDLYDAFDGLDRPEGWKNPVSTPEHLQRLLDAKQRDKDEGTDVHYREELRRQLDASRQPGSTPA